MRTQDYHPSGHISYGSSHFGDGTANSGFDFAGGPLPFVGYEITLSCIEAESGLMADTSCCLINTTQEACASLSGGCTAGTDANNTACTQCVTNPETCITMPQAMWTDHCVQGESGDSGFATGLVTDSSDLVVQKGTNKYVDAYSVWRTTTAPRRQKSGALRTSQPARLCRT